MPQLLPLKEIWHGLLRRDWIVLNVLSSYEQRRDMFEMDWCEAETEMTVEPF